MDALLEDSGSLKRACEALPRERCTGFSDCDKRSHSHFIGLGMEMETSQSAMEGLEYRTLTLFTVKLGHAATSLRPMPTNQDGWIVFGWFDILQVLAGFMQP